MIELALVLTLLVMLLVGTTTAAVAFGQNNSIENAAREASRYAATLPDAGTTTWLQDVRDVTRASAQSNLETGVDGQYICVSYYNGSTWATLTDTAGAEASSTSACFTDTLPADQKRVQVVARRDTEIQAVVFTQTVTLETETAARYER